MNAHDTTRIDEYRVQIRQCAHSLAVAKNDGVLSFLPASEFSYMVDVYTDGNIDLAGPVEFTDFLVLSANFGKTPIAGATAVVPEPSSLTMFALGGLVMWRRRRKRASC